MINYRKSLLSVAAAAAIATTSLSAGYLPLTSDLNDNEWVIFGVSGLKTDGAIATVPGAFTITGGNPNAATDTTVDEIEVANSNNLFQVKAITDADVEVRIDVTGVTFSQNDPVRTIYVDTNGDGAPNFAVSYKAALEGGKLEYSVGGAAASDLTINYENVFNNPVLGNAITGVDAVDGNELKSLTETASAVDYDFNNNPPLSSEWAAADGHRDAIGTNGGNELRVYAYNATDAKWEIYDSRNTVGSNDFTDIVAGKGYWGRLDSENDGNNDAGALEAGLVLGTPSLTTANYANAGLANGWNFISFDAVNSEIRNSAVGMLVTLKTGVTTVLITDSSSNHTITVTPDAANTNIQFAKDVNNAISLAKLEGTLPKTVNIKAFPTNASAATGQVAIISNKKFTINEGSGDKLGAATTLTGAVLLDPTTLIDTTNGADVATPGVMSKYGEYAMVVEPLVGAGTAQSLTDNPASISVTGATDTELLAMGATATNVAIKDVLNADNDLVATEIDLSINGTRSDVLIASTSPFTVRDHTFSRVFKYTTQGATNSAVNISVGPVGPVTIVAGSSADAAATAIQTLGGAATISADDDAAGNVVIVSDAVGAQKFLVTESTADLLQVGSTGTDLDKGAIKNVYSLNYLSKIATRNDVTLDVNTYPDDAADAFRIDVVDTLGTTMTGTVVTIGAAIAALDATGATQADNVVLLDAYKAQVELDLAAAGITATVSHDAATVATLALAVLTISGPDVASVTYTQTNNAGAVNEEVAGVAVVAADLGYIASYSGDLAADLQYNSILTPDYVMAGPLYTMRDNNMTLKALVTGTTDITDGSVSWESVDLTRNPSEWLASQDYDLFDTDAASGYWAYLTADASDNPLSITSSSLSKEYAHHFDEVVATTVGTTTNEFSGNLEILVDGLNAVDNYASARVTATIGGETFELTQDALDKTKFTGSVSVHEAYGFNKNTPYDVIINVADGLGNNLTENLSILDNVKPAAPTVTSVSGELTITTAADDNVTGIYVFSGTPPEVGTEAAKQGYLAGNGGVASAACTGTASLFDANAGGITVFSVDADGVLGSGNASDTTSVAFMPIMINRVLVTNTNNGGVVDSTTGGDDFNASCVNQGPLTVETGVTLSAITADATVQMAYTSQGAIANNDVPVTVYVSDGAGTPTIAEMKYPASYVGTDVFFELNGQVYGYQLQSEAALDGLNNSSTTPIDLTGIGANNPKTGIAL